MQYCELVQLKCEVNQEETTRESIYCANMTYSKLSHL